MSCSSTAGHRGDDLGRAGVAEPPLDPYFVHRRGYPPSPPPPGGRGLRGRRRRPRAAARRGRPHLVMRSCGGLGGLIAARPERRRSVRSLTWSSPRWGLLLPGDPEVVPLVGWGTPCSPREWRPTRRPARVPADRGSTRRRRRPLPEGVASGVRRAQGTRLPGDARPLLAAIRSAGFPPCWLGNHNPRSSASATPSPIALRRRATDRPPAPATSSRQHLALRTNSRSSSSPSTDAHRKRSGINGQPSRPASGPGPFPRLGSGSRASSRPGSGFAPRGCARPRRRDRNRDGSPRPARARSH